MWCILSWAILISSLSLDNCCGLITVSLPTIATFSCILLDWCSWKSFSVHRLPMETLHSTIFSTSDLRPATWALWKLSYHICKMEIDTWPTYSTSLLWMSKLKCVRKWFRNSKVLSVVTVDQMSPYISTVLLSVLPVLKVTLYGRADEDLANTLIMMVLYSRVYLER